MVFNPTANVMMERRAHRSLKASLKVRGKHWMTQLPIILLGLRMQPDDDRTSAFSRVTGKQPLVPHILPPSFNFRQLAIQLHQLQHELKLGRRKEIDSQIPEEIKTCPYVWIRKRHTKCPYKVLQRHEAAYQLLVKGKAVMILLDRL